MRPGYQGLPIAGRVCEHGFVHRAAIVSLTLAACFSKPPRPDGVAGDGKAPDDSPTAEGWLPGYGFRKRVTVTSGIATTLANFPVGVSRTDAQIAEHADSAGRDLVATAADGTTLLASELAAYQSGTFELWVRVPELGASTEIYLYYDGEDAPVSTSTWDGPFAGVWHLSEIGNGRDSSANGNTLTAAGTAIPASAPGVFGPGRHLDGDDSLNGGDPPDGSLDFDLGSFSYSMWVQQTGVLGQFDTPFYKGCASSGEPGYCWLLGAEGWFAKIASGANSSDPEMGPASSFANRWVYLTAVVNRDADTFTGYIDGAPLDAQLLSARGIGSLSTTLPLQIGRGATQSFQGDIDEVRIYDVALSPEWITVEHRNGSDLDFLVFGDEEKAP
jgi:hypothetical protein